MVIARTETTCGHTYSMARAIGATTRQKVLSVHAIICVATHSGSHSSHAPTSPMATLMRVIICHKRRQECHLSVDMSRVHAATIQTGHDMPVGPASLTQFLCCALTYVCRFRFILCGLRFMLSHIVIMVMCTQLLHVLHTHSLRLAPQYH